MATTTFTDSLTAGLGNWDLYDFSVNPGVSTSSGLSVTIAGPYDNEQLNNGAIHFMRAVEMSPPPLIHATKAFTLQFRMERPTTGLGYVSTQWAVGVSAGFDHGAMVDIGGFHSSVTTASTWIWLDVQDEGSNGSGPAGPWFRLVGDGTTLSSQSSADGSAWTTYRTRSQEGFSSPSTLRPFIYVKASKDLESQMNDPFSVTYLFRDLSFTYEYYTEQVYRWAGAEWTTFGADNIAGGLTPAVRARFMG